MVDLIVFRLEAGISTYPFLPLLMNLFEICAEKFIIVFPELHRRRVMVDQLHPLGQFRILLDRLFQPLHPLHPGLVIVQAQAQVSDMGMVVQELEHGAGRCAAQRQIVTVPPLAPGPFHQCGKRERVDRAFRYRQPGTRRISSQQGKVIPLIAALHVNLEIVPRSPQAGEAGAACRIPAHKNTIPIFPAFVERARLDTRLQQLRVDAPALQIGQHGGGEPAGLWECEGLRRLRLGPLLGRRGAGTAQGLHRLHEVQPTDFDEIV